MTPRTYRDWVARLFQAPLADVTERPENSGHWNPPRPTVLQLVEKAPLDSAPTESDCATYANRYAPARWHGDSAAQYGVDSQSLWWRDKIPSAERGVEHPCGCGCGGLYNWCDHCNRRVSHENDYGCPRTTSLYHLCTECREEWERTGQSSD